jgi:hypothetical protein
MESRQRLSRSAIWSLQRRFYEREGAAAWSAGGGLPHYITCNPYIARAYARVVVGFFQDMADAALLDPRQPL